MKKLIVNADDLGADAPRNDGIVESIEAGAVTSVSILPNGPALEDALHRLQSLGSGRISIGVHLNLSQGKPISTGLRHIASRDGLLLGKQAAHQLLLRRGDLQLEEEVRREVEAQITRIEQSGLRIHHLDGHQHVHIFPAVARIAAEKAKEHGIAWVRMPDETDNPFHSDPVTQEVLDEARFFSRHAKAARPFLRACGRMTTDHFRGLEMKGKLPISYWPAFLQALPEGLTELMVHPGRPCEPAAGPFSGFSTVEREMELTALTDGRFRAALAKTGVALILYPEAP